MGKYRSPFGRKVRVSTPFHKPGSWAAGFHTGVDLVPIDGSKHPPLYAIANCTILNSSGGSSYGNHIIARTTDNRVFLMAHMRDRPLVKPGQKVYAGQQVGYMGNTGNSFGEHLHIEVETSTKWAYNSHLVNPLDYIDINKFSNSGCSSTSIIDTFIKEAESHKGQQGGWVWKRMGRPVGEAWCASFICACADKVGKILNYVIYNSPSVRRMVLEGQKKKYGKYLKGPMYGNSPTPQKGDLITFDEGFNTSGYDHIGIVIKVSKSRVFTIEGNVGGRGSRYNHVDYRDYSRTNKMISGYYRPDWSKVDESYTTEEDESVVELAPLYDHLNDRNDMTLREVGYIYNNQPSIKQSNVGLVVINYTDMLYNIFEVVARQGTQNNNNPQYSTASLSAGPKNTINFLVDKGLNTAAAVGIAANIKHESSFNTASIGDNGTSFGICQWHLGRGDNMKRMAGKNWKINLTGQLNYLWYELTNSYKSSVLSPLRSVSNTLSGAKKAADIFVRHFEVPANIDYQSEQRQKTATKYWGKLKQYLQ